MPCQNNRVDTKSGADKTCTTNVFFCFFFNINSCTDLTISPLGTEIYYLLTRKKEAAPQCLLLFLVLPICVAVFSACLTDVPSLCFCPPTYPNLDNTITCAVKMASNSTTLTMSPLIANCPQCFLLRI